MTVEVDLSGLEEQLDTHSENVALEAANYWYSWSYDRLINIDSEETDSNLFSIAESSIPPTNDSGDWVSHWSHLATVWAEYGTDPHEIRPIRAQVLAFPWEEMQGEPFGDTGMTWDEVYASTWPIVFLPKVNHPGTKEHRFIRDGRQETVRWLEGGMQ